MPPLPIVLIHGYSSEGKTTPNATFSRDSVARLYGTLPADLERLNLTVVPVNVSRYISLDDGLGIDDISLAMDRALRSPEHEALLESGFNAIIHSTGALVARNWIRRHWDQAAGKCPLKRLIHLAGANLGSGWAHIGQSQVARFARMFNGTERGLAVLRALELASSWTIDLHTHFLETGTRILADYGVMEFCLIGSQVPPEYVLIPVRYGKEDGSDGVVRVSASNLNFNYLRIEPTAKALALGWEEALTYSRSITRRALKTRPDEAAFDQDYYRITFDSGPGRGGRERIPFAIPYQTCHGDPKLGIVSGTENRAQMLDLISRIVNTDEGGYAALAASFDAVTDGTYQQVAVPEHTAGVFAGLRALLKNALPSPQSQYDPHSQLVFRLRDQRGQSVPDFSIFFNSMGGDDDGPATQLINELFEDKHKNDATPNTINLYLRVETFDAPSRTWKSRLPAIRGVDLEIDATDPVTDRIVYLPIRLRIDSGELQKWVEPHRTTIVDVTLFRLPSSQAFILR